MQLKLDVADAQCDKVGESVMDRVAVHVERETVNDGDVVQVHVLPDMHDPEADGVKLRDVLIVPLGVKVPLTLGDLEELMVRFDSDFEVLIDGVKLQVKLTVCHGEHVRVHVHVAVLDALWDAVMLRDCNADFDTELEQVGDVVHDTVVQLSEGDLLKDDCSDTLVDAEAEHEVEADHVVVGRQVHESVQDVLWLCVAVCVLSAVRLPL